MPERPSHGKEFFERARREGFPFISSLVNLDQPTFETDWLDFKGAARFQGQDLMKTWGEALSGYANSGGGVIVFGVDARNTCVSLLPIIFSWDSKSVIPTLHNVRQ